MPLVRAAGPRRRRFPSSEIEKIASSPREEIAHWVRSTAEELGVAYVATAADRFAHDASRLSDAGAELDDVEELLLAIRRTGLLSSIQRLQLHVGYLRNVR